MNLGFNNDDFNRLDKFLLTAIVQFLGMEKRTDKIRKAFTIRLSDATQ